MTRPDAALDLPDGRAVRRGEVGAIPRRMKRSSVLFLSLLCISAACDEVDPDTAASDGLLLVSPEGVEPADVDDVSFRGGPPAALYVTKWGGKAINRAVAKQIIDHCVKQIDPPQTCTLSWYQPDTTKPTFVLGLGCSMMATIPLLDCYRTAFLTNGGKAI